MRVAMTLEQHPDGCAVPQHAGRSVQPWEQLEWIGLGGVPLLEPRPRPCAQDHLAEESERAARPDQVGRDKRLPVARRQGMGGAQGCGQAKSQ